jgi:hypothetical protein
LSISVTPVRSSGDLSEFIAFPYRLHRKNPAYVPPLISHVRRLLDTKSNPFFQHAEMEMFLARIEGRVVGRIAAIVDRNYPELNVRLVGLFGFFDCIDDIDVAHALFNSASAWHRLNKLRKIMGPVNPSLNDEVGVLQNYHDEPPAFMMAWNPDYYPALYENSVFNKAQDLYAYALAREDVTEKIRRFGALQLKHARVVITSPTKKTLKRDPESLRQIVNQARATSWGYTPFSEEEFKRRLSEFGKYLDPGLVIYAEDNNRQVGVSLSIPDMNVILRKFRSGRLSTFAKMRVWWRKRKLRDLRIVMLGTTREYANRGIDTALYYQTFETATSKNFERAEISWIPEENESARKSLEIIGAKQTKIYRLYQRDLLSG